MFHALQNLANSAVMERATLLLNHVLASETVATERLRRGVFTSVPEAEWDFFNYQVGLVYKPTATSSLYASYATASTPPLVFEQFFPGRTVGQGVPGFASGTLDVALTQRIDRLAFAPDQAASRSDYVGNATWTMRAASVDSQTKAMAAITMRKSLRWSASRICSVVTMTPLATPAPACVTSSVLLMPLRLNAVAMR